MQKYDILPIGYTKCQRFNNYKNYQKFFKKQQMCCMT